MKRMLILYALVLAACAHEPQQATFPALEQKLEKPRADYSGGSIWQAGSGGLVEDFKARMRGDTVTVVITENASASKSATTSTNRQTAVAAGIPNLMGLETNMTGIKNWMDLNKLLSADTSSKYDGSGSTTRKENLSATITARVVDVLANGNLLIEGRRNIRVNNEDQYIVLEGTVRPKDISPENVVLSAQVADARIIYSGKGIVSDRQKPGWLMNIIDQVWPF